MRSKARIGQPGAELEFHEHAKLVKRGASPPDASQRARLLITEMRRGFIDAEITGWEALEGTFGLPDPDDEHVVAAAVLAGSGAVVTENTKDFPSEKMPHGIQVLTAREFATNTVALDPRRALAALHEISSRSGRHGPNLTVTQILMTLRDRYRLAGAVEMMLDATEK